MVAINIGVLLPLDQKIESILVAELTINFSFKQAVIIPPTIGFDRVGLSIKTFTVSFTVQPALSVIVTVYLPGCVMFIAVVVAPVFQLAVKPGGVFKSNLKVSP